MPFFSGFAQGASDALTTMRQEQQRINEAQNQREQAALLHLTNSEDTDTAAAAATALLHPDKPPAGGFLKTLFGMQNRPEYPTLVGLLKATRGHPAGAGGGTGGAGTAFTDDAASPAGASPAASPPPQGSAALPAGSPAEAGSPPMALPVSPKVASSTMGATPQASAAPAPMAAQPPPAAPAPSTPPPPSAGPGVAAAGGGWTGRPPVFATRAYTDALDVQKAGNLEQAQLQGKLTAFRSAQNPLEQRLLGGAAFNPIMEAGTVRTSDALREDPNARDEMGGLLNTQSPDAYWRAIRMPDMSVRYRPASSPTSLQVKPTVQVLMGPDRLPHKYSVVPDGQGGFNHTDMGQVPVKENRVTWTDENNQVRSTPLTSIYQVPPGFQGPPAGAAATPPPGPASATPSGPAPARGGTGAIPSAGGPQSRAGGGGRGEVLGTTKQATEQKEGAIIGPDGYPQQATADFNPVTRKYYAPNSTQELQGFIPGAMGESAVTAFANGKKVLDTVDGALEAIRKSGFADSTDPADTLRLWTMYRGGRANPVADAFGALTSLADLQQSLQFVKGNSRSMQMFEAAKAHTALLPTDQEAAIGAGAGMAHFIPSVIRNQVTPENAMVTGHHPWDSPKQMVDKLTTARGNTAKGLDELRTSVGKVPGRAIGGGSATAPPGGSVKMRAPDGGSLTVPAADVERMKAAGATVVQ